MTGTMGVYLSAAATRHESADSRQPPRPYWRANHTDSNRRRTSRTAPPFPFPPCRNLAEGSSRLEVRRVERLAHERDGQRLSGIAMCASALRDLCAKSRDRAGRGDFRRRGPAPKAAIGGFREPRSHAAVGNAAKPTCEYETVHHGASSGSLTSVTSSSNIVCTK